MSWDILIQDLPPVATIDDIPADFQPKSLGQRYDLIERIKAAIPTADFSAPDWGMLDGDGWSIELNMGAGPECDSVMLHVRGRGMAHHAVQEIIDAVGARAIDMQTSQFFEVENSEGSFKAWQEYRDQVIATDKRP